MRWRFRGLARAGNFCPACSPTGWRNQTGDQLGGVAAGEPDHRRRLQRLAGPVVHRRNAEDLHGSWEAAAAIGKAFTFAGNNPIGATKNGRIDYIFYSKGASNLTLVQSQVVDTRNAAGVMPSDHRPVVTTLDVR